MTPPEAEIGRLKARIARAEMAIYFVVGLCVCLLAIVFSLAVGHGGRIARLQAGAEGPGAIAPAGPPFPAPGKIEATSFVLKDAQGRERISMGVLPDDSVFFGVSGSSGVMHLGFLARPNGSSTLTLTGNAGSGVVVSAEPTGEAGIAVGDDHKVLIETATDYRGAALKVIGEGGKVIGKLP